MARPITIGPANILTAAESVLRQHGGSSFTLDRVASAAKCAKGLVHYHFGTRSKLLTAVNDQLWDARERNWAAALRDPSPEVCVRQSWTLLSTEAAQGITRAWLSLLVEPDPHTLQAARRRLDRFETVVLGAATALFDSLDLTPTIAPPELGRLLAAGIHGLGVQLVAHGRSQVLETAYSALWLSALSLTQSKP
jgi:AcrR family transcriptional regulator